MLEREGLDQGEPVVDVLGAQLIGGEHEPLHLPALAAPRGHAGQGHGEDETGERQHRPENGPGEREVTMPAVWPKTTRAAVRLQERLRGKLELSGGPRRVRLVAGADLSYAKGSDQFFAAVVVVDFPSLSVVEEATAEGRSPFPYIPGLLSFREGPLLLRAFRNLACRPDLLFFDGHGIAHPRGFGIAAHLGLLLGIPSLGCGKSRLVGEHAEPGESAGSVAPLRYRGRRVGTVVRTRARTKPLFVSPGHLLGHAAAVRWALRLCDGYRLPAPVRLAHLASNALRIA